MLIEFLAFVFQTVSAQLGGKPYLVIAVIVSKFGEYMFSAFLSLQMTEASNFFLGEKSFQRRLPLKLSVSSIIALKKKGLLALYGEIS